MSASIAIFLRFDELSKLHPADLTLDKDKLTIKVQSSKIKFKKGDEVIILRVGSDTCLIGMLKNKEVPFYH